VAGIIAIVQYNERQRAAPDDGAVIAKAANVAIELKRAMRDPDSFRLSSVLIIEKTNAVCYEYRSRNGFGGMNVGQAVLSPKGSFRTNEMDGFHTLWRSECSGKMGREVVDAVTFLLDHPTS
jgi:hypothetical protein